MIFVAKCKVQFLKTLTSDFYKTPSLCEHYIDVLILRLIQKLSSNVVIKSGFFFVPMIFLASPLGRHVGCDARMNRADVASQFVVEIHVAFILVPQEN